MFCQTLVNVHFFWPLPRSVISAKTSRHLFTDSAGPVIESTCPYVVCCMLYMVFVIHGYLICQKGLLPLTSLPPSLPTAPAPTPPQPPGKNFQNEQTVKKKSRMVQQSKYQKKIKTTKNSKFVKYVKAVLIVLNCQ